jgi:deazaflavin-dependent oxidoreductase (nitroreductase family)
MSVNQTASGDRVHKPSRMLKFIFDVPSAMYRMGLGWILGRRVLAVTHRGRSSGTPYTTILEVAAFDRDTQESVVASAYGEEADWYRNIQVTPAIRVQTGRLDYIPQQRFLGEAEARAAATKFCGEHPWEARLVPRVLPAIGAAISARVDETPEEILSSLPMVAFRPKE